MKKLILWLGMAVPAMAFQASPGNDPAAARTRSEALCGPEIVLLGDAWEHVQLERDALLELLKSGDLVKVPQKMAALHSHLVFMQNRGVMIFGNQRETVQATITEVEESIPRWNALALADQRNELFLEWPVLVRHLRTIGGQFPKEALVSSSEASFVLPPLVPTLQVHLDPLPVLQAGKPAEVRFRLIGPGEIPVIVDHLHTTHTEKLHALLLDPLFRDYHHEHPQPTDVPGEYVFRFTPRESGPYRLWLDAMPVATGRGEFPIADLETIPRPIAKAPNPPAAITEATSGDFQVKLETPPGGLTFGSVATITAVVQDKNGAPFSKLEPLMGAFAHVVGFADDFQSILHIHPMGVMPVPGELGGPRVDFQLRPLLPGWLRLYFQFQVDGKVHLVEFAVPVTVK